MMKKIMKKETNGITLIALVVTIVVLLILAGVSINMVLGQNGIVTKAQEARDKTEQAKQNDLASMDQFVKDMDDILNDNPSSLSPSTLHVVVVSTVYVWSAQPFSSVALVYVCLAVAKHSTNF